MKIKLWLFILVSFSCNERKEIKSETKQATNYPIDGSYHMLLEKLNKSELFISDTDNSIIRFTYNDVLAGYNQHFELNFNDSILTYTNFHWSNNNRYFDKTKPTITKLTKKDLDTLEYLIEASMIWSLEMKTTSDYLDCDYYIYEAIRQPIHYNELFKTYCLVLRHCPHNEDFIKLGNYIKYKANAKDYSGKITYWR